jgi:hypothetical protein
MVAVVSSSVWVHPKAQGTHEITSNRSAPVRFVHANVLVFIAQTLYCTNEQAQIFVHQQQLVASVDRTLGARPLSATPNTSLVRLENATREDGDNDDKNDEEGMSDSRSSQDNTLTN